MTHAKITIQSSGKAIVAGVVFVVMIIVLAVGTLLLQDFVVGEFIAFEKLMGITAALLAGIVLFSILPPLSAYFRGFELDFAHDFKLQGTGLVYVLPDSDVHEGRGSTFALRRAIGRVEPDNSAPLALNRVEANQTRLGKIFDYGTLILTTGDLAVCIDYVDDIASVVRSLRVVASGAKENLK